MEQLQEAINSQLQATLTLPLELQEIIDRGRDDEELFARELLGMPMHDGQIKFIRKGKKKINVLVPANRFGKTAIIAIKHIHRCFYKVGIGMGDMEGWLGVDYRTANLAPQSPMTEPCFTYMKQILQGRFPIPQADGSVTNNKCLITWFLLNDKTINTAPYMLFFANNSRTEFRSLGQDKGDSLQGKPYGYISYDEAGRSNHLEREIKNNILPRLTDLNGELDIVSTPDTDSASILYHYELYLLGMHDDENVYTQEGTIEENTFLRREVIEAQIRLYKNDPLAPQVLYGKFVFSGANVFSADDILAAKDETLIEGERYVTGYDYVFGIDTAMGSDEFVLTCLHVTPLTPQELAMENPPLPLMRVVKKYAKKGNARSPQGHLSEVDDIFNLYNQNSNVKINLETWNGESARFYLDMPKDLQRVTRCYGAWQPPGLSTEARKARRMSNKADIIVALNKALAARKLKYSSNDDVLSKQLSIYRENDEKIPQDHVISLALAVWLATHGRPKVAKVQFVAVEW